VLGGCEVPLAEVFPDLQDGEWAGWLDIEVRTACIDILGVTGFAVRWEGDQEQLVTPVGFSNVRV
jgi:hypothetical protein